jgi:hypothetical protein
MVAQRFLGNIMAYNLIFQATNAAVGTDDSFTAIQDPHVIEPGQTAVKSLTSTPIKG